MTLRIVIAQLDFMVGDVAGNARRIRETAAEARDRLGAQAVVFPELTLSGYPPEDLVLRRDFLTAVEAALDELARDIDGITGAIAQNAPLTIALAKAAAREIAKPESKQDHAKLDRMAEACFDSEDFKEGRRAFMDKRKPAFKGR